jgi:hypothetical protein
VQELFVELGDLGVLFVVAVGEGAAFGLFYFLVFGQAVGLGGQLVFAFFADFLEFA